MENSSRIEPRMGKDRYRWWTLGKSFSIIMSLLWFFCDPEGSRISIINVELQHGTE
jgi:hypothetical protein